MGIEGFIISVINLRQYGYENPLMFPLQEKKAVELFEKGEPIYLLYQDDTEALALSKEEIIKHFSYGGLVGIEKQK